MNPRKSLDSVTHDGKSATLIVGSAPTGDFIVKHERGIIMTFKKVPRHKVIGRRLVRYTFYVLLIVGTWQQDPYMQSLALALIIINLEFQRRYNDRQLEFNASTHKWAGETNTSLEKIGEWMTTVNDIARKGENNE